MDDFFRTPMGRKFFEATVPALVRELARLNENLEKDREQRERAAQPVRISPESGKVGS